MSRLDDLLRPFQPSIHRFILVEDPDGLLRDESVLARLAHRGYRIVVDEGDPVRLRHEATAGPDGAPLLILTTRPLNTLPYDWWQSAHHVTVHLANWYPALNPAVLAQVTDAEQRWRLSQATPPRLPRAGARLGREATTRYLLAAIFDADPDALRTPASLIVWLSRYHHDLPGSLPQPLRDWLLDQLRQDPVLGQWALDELLDDPEQFGRFVSEQWASYLARTTGQPLAEQSAAYRLDFAAEPALQDALAPLVRRGVVERVPLREVDQLPRWARVAAIGDSGPEPEQLMADRLARLEEQAEALIDNPGAGRWAAWRDVAMTWAELTRLSLTNPQLAANPALARWQERLDTAFAAWLETGYPALASQKLPVPHHVHHVPHVMAYDRRQRERPAALLVLDGLSLADWLRIRSIWAARHPDWQRDDRALMLAQIPTVTSVSRQALVSGQRPASFAKSLNSNRLEAKEWTTFWTGEGIAAGAVAYDHLRPDWAAPAAGQIAALCLIYMGLDDQLHGATQGARDAWASLGVWLDEASHRIEAAIDGLLDAGYVVYVSSDHGHVEAWGMGQPSEGVTAHSRGKRSRVYRTVEAAAAVQARYPATRQWRQDGLLPDDMVVLMPTDAPRRAAFAPDYQQVVAHGGLTLDEVVVPLVCYSKQEAEIGKGGEDTTDG